MCRMQREIADGLLTQNRLRFHNGLTDAGCMRGVCWVAGRRVEACEGMWGNVGAHGGVRGHV